jgi:hypothetical protein
MTNFSMSPKSGLKLVLWICFLALFIGAFVADLRVGSDPRLGVFSADAKKNIAEAIRELCHELDRASGCEVIQWTGKHRWFGSVSLADARVAVNREILKKTAIQLGWLSMGSSSNIDVFVRRGFELSAFGRGDLIEKITITTVPRE